MCCQNQCFLGKVAVYMLHEVLTGKWLANHSATVREYCMQNVCCHLAVGGLDYITIVMLRHTKISTSTLIHFIGCGKVLWL